MKNANVEVSQRDLPTDSQKQTSNKQSTTSMVALSKPEVDRMLLLPEQMKILFEQIKLEEGTAEWTEEQKDRVKVVIQKYSFLFAVAI